VSQKFRDPPLSVAEEELMTITKQDINAVLTRLTEAFPQAFVLEQYQPHRPLKGSFPRLRPAARISPGATWLRF
jgi:hypothetical protein